MKKLMIIAITGAAFAGIGLWIYFAVLDRFILAQRKHEAEDIVLVFMAYAKDHDGHMPSSFSQLSPWDREQKDMQGVSIVIEREIPNFELVTTDPTYSPDPSRIWIRERYPDSRGRRVFCYRNGDTGILQESH
jgi:hypothetical protein